MMTKSILFVFAFLLAFEGWGGLTAHADTRCAKVYDGAIVEYLNTPESDLTEANGCWPDAPHKGIRWLPAPLPEPPAFNPATQELSGPTITIGETEVTTSYSVRDKTAQELTAEADAAKEAQLNSVALFVLKTLCDHESRIRVLEGKSAITLAQCRAAIKGALQ
jgi:hypothetical protein